MIRIIALTNAGHLLAKKIQHLLGDAETSVWFKPKPFGDKVQTAFRNGDALILICATGIAVRTLASAITSKHDDPPVLVLDELGQFVIPLLSGHEGGANEWGRQLSSLLNAQLVMTTANSYVRPVYTVGMGCERDCPQTFIDDLFAQCLAEARLDINQINSLNSIDIKSDEIALIAAAKQAELPFAVWKVDELKQVESQLQTPSDYVYKTVGVYGVAESAALFAAQALTGNTAELVLAKQKNTKATCAIARSYLNHE